jgi:hypothetical protein
MIEISKYWRTGDQDWLPALWRAQDDWDEGLSTADPSRGFTLLFEPIVYEFSDTIPLIRGMSLVGSGGSFYSNGTVFRFPAGKHGILVCEKLGAPARPAALGTPPARPRPARPGAPVGTSAECPPRDGFGSIIERITIVASAADAAGPLAHGVVMHNRAVLKDVYVEGFSGDGLHIVAAVDGLVDDDGSVVHPSNASVWQATNCTLSGCGRHGLYVSGPDANAGCAIALDLRNNGGWGVLDESFLGNTYLGCVAHANIGGSFSAPQTIGSSAFLNCYAEGDQPKARISRVHFVLGSIFDVEPPPGETVGPAMISADGGAGVALPNSARAYGLPASAGDPERQRVSLSIGSSEAPNVALALERLPQRAAELPYRLVYGVPPGTAGAAQAPGWWDMNYGAQPSASAFRLSTEQADARYGPGQFWMPRGYFIGNPNEGAVPVIRTVAGTGIPTSEPGSGGAWQRGDRVLNAAPDPLLNPWAGWICVESPQPGDTVGKWRPFGALA